MIERIREVLDTIGDDAQGRKLVTQVLQAAADYVRAVTAMEGELLGTLADGEERRQLTERLDRNRTLAHNALIDALNICTRYLGKGYPDLPPGGIYPEPAHLMDRNRRAIGDWAGRVVTEFFTTRR